MSVPAEAIERARAVDILATAERFTTLKKVTANERAGPCPSCGGDDRFRLNVKKRAFLCRGCGSKGVGAIVLVMLALGVDFAKAVEELAGSSSAQERIKPRAPRKDVSEAEDAARNGRLALTIWNGARSIRSTIAERYLADIRGIDIGQILELDDVLRFDPACPFGADRLPCLVALVRAILTDQPKAIQRTALAPDGQKLERRSLGSTKGGAIKLWGDDEVTTGLVVGEGLETTAAAATRIEHRGTALRPAWALLDRANLAALPVLAGVEALSVLIDADESGDGQKAADSCERRWLEAGREVTKLTPKTLGADFADIVAGTGT